MPRTLAPLLLLFFFNAAESSWQDIAKEGTLARLNGDYAKAKLIEQRLIEEANYPIGHIFAINTIITHFSWDDTTTKYDEAIFHHTEQVMKWCEPILSSKESSAIANHYCGQASFALSLYHGLKGNYIRAGQHGSQAIGRLESALTANPNLTDAKLHLGIAYFVADNLPPFIKLFGRFLWFVPTGNSEKSLPYLLDVIRGGDEFPDVARYIYSTLMLLDESTIDLAVNELKYLVEQYPKNSRFQLRLISVYLMQKNYAAALSHAKSYLQYDPTGSDLTLTHVWMVRANIGLRNLQQAERLLENLEKTTYESLPSWSRSWHLLSIAQIEDLNGRRDLAIKRYKEILSISESDYVDELLVKLAESGIARPYEFE